MKLKLQDLLKNKYVLYAVLFLAITNVLGYLTVRDYRSLTMFASIGVLSTYFSKNMIVNLGVAMLFTNVFFANNLLEGLKNKDDSEEDDEKDTKQPSEGSKEDVDVKESMVNSKKAKKNNTKKRLKECPKGQVLSAGKCITSTTEKFSQHKIPSSQPASATESEEDVEIGDRIDYAATLEQAYDNLQNILGSKGMSGLTNDTQKLIAQQKSLMGTLNNMAPLLNTAKDTLSGLNMGDLTKGLSNITGMLQNVNGQPTQPTKQ
jgi:hypothetical protein